MKTSPGIHACDIAENLIQDLERFGVRPAKSSEVTRAREFAAQLIGDGIVKGADLERVHTLSGGSCLFLTNEGEELTGVLAFVLLSARGLQALHSGAFNALAPQSDHVAGPGSKACAFYGWGVAATTKPSARRVVEGAREIMAGAVGHLPKYARPTTEAGHRLMRERLGFVDLPGSRDGLVWQPPLEQAVAA
jgi:hypothetical protein